MCLFQGSLYATVGEKSKLLSDGLSNKTHSNSVYCIRRPAFRYSVELGECGDRALLTNYVVESGGNGTETYNITLIDEFILGTVAFCSSKLALKVLASLVLLAASLLLITSAVIVSQDERNNHQHLCMLLFSFLACFCCAPASLWTIIKPGTIDSFWATNPTIVNWVLANKITTVPYV